MNRQAPATATSLAALRIVHTKLRPPRVRQGLIERVELVERLREGRDRTLTLVSAPAGYGKTTLLAQWEAADRDRTPFVWVALDKRDSDPVRLWSHIIGGLHFAWTWIGDGSLAALTGGGPAPIPEAVLPVLIDELADAPPLVLVLEDWHTVTNPLCDETMALFVERAPEHVQVVISSRSDPGLPIARLRAHDELVELRARDLRISPAEARQLAREADMPLDDADVARLTERTEGWLAGLCLALLVVKDQDDPQRFIAEFSGDGTHVLDYLARDVLDAVPDALREFLVRSSVLDRLSAAACDAVLERSDSALMLAEIERSNLFLVSLDASGKVYRYHQLFAAMLARELEATEPTALPALHGRAADWFEVAGDYEVAIEHAIAGRAVGRASDLIARHGQSYWASGRLATVAHWLEALSWPEALADGQLALVRAHVLGLSGRPRDEVERWLGSAELSPDRGPLANGIVSLRCGVAILRAGYLTQGLAIAEQEARLAYGLQPSNTTWGHVVRILLGQALYLLGRSDEARVLLDGAEDLPGAHETAPATALGLSYSALIALERGEITRGTRLARAAISVLDELQLSTGVAAANPYLALGRALGAGTDLRTAAEHLEHAAGLAAPQGASYWHVHALLRLADIRLRLGDRAAATAAVTQARSELDVLPDTGMLEGLYSGMVNELHGRRRRDGYLGEALSDAEHRVLELLVEGKSVSEVAHELWLSANTVKTHRRSIYRKLGATNREEMLDRAVAAGLSEPATRGVAAE